MLIVKLNCIVELDSVDIYLKLEFMNLGSSVKDCIVLVMIEDVEKKGLLKEGDIIIELISGNIGIGLVMVVVVKGYNVILVMLEIMSIECRNLLCVYGVELVLILGFEGMGGVICKVIELVKEYGYFIL